VKYQAKPLTVAKRVAVPTSIGGATTGSVSKKSRNVNWGRRHGDNNIRVGLIDERPLTRESLSYLLSTNGPEFEFSSFSDVAELLEVHVGGREPLRLVLFNIGSAWASDEKVRVDIERLRTEIAETPVVLLTDCEDVRCISQAFRWGVRGYIATRLDPTVVIEALRLVQVGGTYLPADLLVKALDVGPQSEAEKQHLKSIAPQALASLTPRQLEVLDRLRQGMTNKLIAYELQMQESTVKVHVRHIMKKLKATNRTQAALLATQSTAT
jgi:DNA-binding NarL/FixJ family response regulator